jgi:hypothetical protein
MTSRRPLIGLAKAVLVLAFCYHALAVTHSGLVPSNSALSQEIAPLFFRYLRTTGNVNDWAMFIDRPMFRSFDVVAVARTADGDTVRFGPLLPDLEPYDGSMRALKLFIKFGKQSNAEPRRLYLNALRRTLAKQRGIEAREVWLEYESEVFNSTPEIRKTGVIAKKRVSRLGQ